MVSQVPRWPAEAIMDLDKVKACPNDCAQLCRSTGWSDRSKGRHGAYNGKHDSDIIPPDRFDDPPACSESERDDYGRHRNQDDCRGDNARS